LLVIVTFRPEFEPHWGGLSHVTVHMLNRLGRRQSAAMITHVTGGKPLPGLLHDQIVAKTDGVPLFIEELTRAVIESDIVVDTGVRYELSGSVSAITIPDTLHDSLMARLDKLIPVKEVAQIGAAIGREFSHQLMAALSPMGEASLRAALDRLVASQLVYRRGVPPEATYIFKHALV
jgi:predicted ATPase